MEALMYNSMLKLIISMIFSFAMFAQDFEGEVQLKIESDGETANINYMMKDGKIRIDLPDQQEDAAMVMNPADNEMLIIIPSQQMYMVHQIPEYTGLEAEEDYQDDLNRTGETKDIRGYTAEKWIITDKDGNVTEAWVTDKLGNFMSMKNPMQAGKRKSLWESRIEGFFPMLVITRDKSGNEKERFEVISVEQKSLDEAKFTPPAGYQKMQMPGMN